MLSKNQTKRITSLKQKKYRLQERVFSVEGIKSVREFLTAGVAFEAIYSSSPDFIEKTSADFNIPVIAISDKQLEKITALKSPQQVLGLFKIPEQKPIKEVGITVALDDIRDPGNLGTIIRLCDWYGVTDLVCSEATVDCYNPKVVQATMGSLSRVQVHYTSLESFLQEEKRPVFGTFMDGTNLYRTTVIKDAIILMGNEANGISSIIEKRVDTRITIPKFGQLQATESLNVATATAICLSEFFRS